MILARINSGEVQCLCRLLGKAQRKIVTFAIYPGIMTTIMTTIMCVMRPNAQYDELLRCTERCTTFQCNFLTRRAQEK